MAFAKNELRRSAEKIAKDTLCKEGNRMILSVATVICASLTMIMWLLSDLPSIILEMCGVSQDYWYYVASEITLVFLIMFFVAPVFMGTFGVAVRMLLNEPTELVDIFDAFSSFRSYIRALRLSFDLLFRILPIIIVFRVPYVVETLDGFGLIHWGFEFPEWGMIVAKIVFALIGVGLVLIVCRSFGFVSFTFLDKNISVRKAVKNARKARKRNHQSIRALAYVTFFKLILSVLTLGILTIVHTVPLAMLTYVTMADKMKQDYETKTERIDI